jgi:hypothetical protein
VSDSSRYWDLVRKSRRARVVPDDEYRRASHEWSIDIIRAQSKGKPRRCAPWREADPTYRDCAEVMAGVLMAESSGVCNGKWQAAT